MSRRDKYANSGDSHVEHLLPRLFEVASVKFLMLNVSVLPPESVFFGGLCLWLNGLCNDVLGVNRVCSLLCRE